MLWNIGVLRIYFLAISCLTWPIAWAKRTSASQVSLTKIPQALIYLFGLGGLPLLYTPSEAYHQMQMTVA